MQEETTMPLPQAQQQQQQQTAASGIDVLNQLIKQRNQLETEVSGLSRAATVPIAGSASTSPNLTMTPVHQLKEVPLDTRELTGASNVKKQTVANTIASLANMVGQFEQRHEEEQKRVLSVDIERIMQAQNGVQEAQQTLQIDPNNAEAKAAIQKNNNIINAMLSDPKRRKAIAKAMDISFTDPSQNTSMEHGALQDAAKSYADQFRAQQPTQMQPNVIAQQQYALKAAQQKAVDDMIAKVAPTIVREQGAADRQQIAIEAKHQDTEYQQQHADARATFTALKAYDRVIEAAQIHNNGLMAKQASANQAAMERLDKTLSNKLDVVNLKINDPLQKAKALNGIGKGYEQSANYFNNQVRALTAQKQQVMTALANKQIDKNKANAMNQDIDTQIQAAQATSKYFMDQSKLTLDQAQSVAEAIKNGNSNSSSTSNIGDSGLSGAKEVRPTVGDTEDTDDTDPDDY